MNIKRVCLYFLIALILEGVLLVFSGSTGLAMLFLFPGMLLSALISHGSNTSNASFIIGLVVDAALYASLALVAEKAIRQRRKPN